MLRSTKRTLKAILKLVGLSNSRTSDHPLTVRVLFLIYMDPLLFSSWACCRIRGGSLCYQRSASNEKPPCPNRLQLRRHLSAHRGGVVELAWSILGTGRQFGGDGQVDHLPLPLIPHADALRRSSTIAPIPPIGCFRDSLNLLGWRSLRGLRQASAPAALRTRGLLHGHVNLGRLQVDRTLISFHGAYVLMLCSPSELNSRGWRLSRRTSLVTSCGRSFLWRSRCCAVSHRPFMVSSDHAI